MHNVHCAESKVTNCLRIKSSGVLKSSGLGCRYKVVKFPPRQATSFRPAKTRLLALRCLVRTEGS